MYSVIYDVDGAKIAQQMGTQFHKAIVGMLASASDPLMTDPRLVASMLQGAIVGVSRRMVESDAPEKQFDILCPELISMACAYLDVCSAARSGAPGSATPGLVRPAQFVTHYISNQI